MRLRALASLPLAATTAGCVYLNGLYNAEHAYGAAEKARFAGRDSAALAGYADAERKAERSFLKEPTGAWAQRSLYLLGRARLRRGDWAGAGEALERVRDAAQGSPALRAAATLYLGAVAVATDDRDRATALLNEALARVPPGSLRGEGHLWRARLFLSMGLVDQGWWDLERAGEEDGRFRVPAALERVTWAIVNADSARAIAGARTLLLDVQGARRIDSLTVLLRLEEERRGPAAAALLLQDAERAAWSPVDRDRLILLRARMHVRAADTALAVADGTRLAEQPASRAGEAAARLFLARIGLAGAQRADALDEVRAVLLPAIGDPVAQHLVEGIDQVVLLAGRAQDGPPLALFAAAEAARDVLGAPALATALFLDYAGQTPPPLWRGKALLAALDATPDPRLKEEIRRRAAALASDPYVSVALGGTGNPAAYEQLERELRQQLGGLVAQVTAEVRTRNPLVRAPQDTLTAEPR